MAYSTCQRVQSANESRWAVGSCTAASHRAIVDCVSSTVDDKAGKCGVCAVNVDIMHLVAVASDKELYVVPVSDCGT